METFVFFFAQLILVSFVNIKAYYFIGKRVFRSSWIGPLLIAGVYLNATASEIRTGTNGSWLRLLTIILYILFILSSFGAVIGGFLDRREEPTKSPLP